MYPSVRIRRVLPALRTGAHPSCLCVRFAQPIIVSFVFALPQFETCRLRLHLFCFSSQPTDVASLLALFLQGATYFFVGLYCVHFLNVIVIGRPRTVRTQIRWDATRCTVKPGKHLLSPALHHPTGYLTHSTTQQVDVCLFPSDHRNILASLARQ